MYIDRMNQMQNPMQGQMPVPTQGQMQNQMPVPGMEGAQPELQQQLGRR